jgi:hypothetical protein
MCCQSTDENCFPFQLIWFQGPMRRLSTDDELLLEGRENRLILSIETMKEKYFANFTCQADNEMGRSAATLPLSGEDLKGQCHEIFVFWSFHESVSPTPLSIPLGPFRIFSKIRGDIRSSNLPPVSLIPVAILPPVSLTH